MESDNLGLQEKTYSVVREPVPHDSAVTHVTGAAAYIDDVSEPAGTLHLAPGFAPIAAGRITGLDLDAVRKTRGVVAVLTARDIPGANDISPKGINDDPVIAADKVNFYGQVVFVVIAESRLRARQAVRLAKISTAPSMPARRSRASSTAAAARQPKAWVWLAALPNSSRR